MANFTEEFIKEFKKSLKNAHMFTYKDLNCSVGILSYQFNDKYHCVAWGNINSDYFKECLHKSVKKVAEDKKSLMVKQEKTEQR